MWVAKVREQSQSHSPVCFAVWTQHRYCHDESISGSVNGAVTKSRCGLKLKAMFIAVETLIIMKTQ